MFAEALTPLLFLLLKISFTFITFWMSMIVYFNQLFETEFFSSPTNDYDYIIIGGGSAGCVLANRLSEDTNIRVLLIEAGGTPSFLTEIPALTATLQLTPYDWQFETVPQKSSCLGMIDRKCKWPRGKMLGGTSGMNYMLYVRGSDADFDEWNAFGNEGWSYKDVLPYFKKAENQLGEFKNSPYHGTKGPLNISDSVYVTPLVDLYESLAKDAGYSVNDVNAKTQIGFSVPQMTAYKGSRRDTYRSYVKPILNRKNLSIIKYATVTKILIENLKAYGVEYLQNGFSYRVNASVEVILSAGSIGSPFILLHSGIGPKEHLEEMGIETLVDLPVGENLQDHVTTFIGPFLVTEPVTLNLARILSPSVLYDYIVNGSGPLSFAIDSMLFSWKRNESLSDFSFTFLPFSIISDLGLFFIRSSSINSQLWDEFLSKYYNMDSATILPVLLKPKSRGRITLASKDPFTPPNIDPQYFSHPDDLNNLVSSIQWIRNVYLQPKSNNSLLHKYGFKLPSESASLSLCTQHELYSDNYWKCYVQTMTLTMYHPVGTVSMGPVLDSQLRVRGLSNLRVVDGSIMPTIVRANTNSAIIMIAEKASDMIKASNSLRHSSQSFKKKLYQKEEF